MVGNLRRVAQTLERCSRALPVKGTAALALEITETRALLEGMTDELRAAQKAEVET